MKAVSGYGYLSLVLLGLFLVVFGGGTAADLAAVSSTTTPVATKPTAADVGVSPAALPDTEGPSETASAPTIAPAADCEPTRPIMLRPYYLRRNAVMPTRSIAATCSPMPC
jgi:hypothetical protein